MTHAELDRTHSVLVFETIYVAQKWAVELEENINHIIDRLMDQVDQDPEDGEESIPTPSGETFDGCEVCVRREVMVLTVMATIDAMGDGLVERRLIA
jgi:hypothetical protein